MTDITSLRRYLEANRFMPAPPPELMFCGDGDFRAIGAEFLERLVQDAIIHLMENRTSLVIAHRLSTIKNADEIIVMQKGEIIERGTHETLVALNGFYNRLVEMQEIS